MLRTTTLLLALAGASWAADAVPAVDSAPATPAAVEPAKASDMPAPAANELSTRQKASYLIGRQMAGAVKEYKLDLALVLEGIQSAVADKESTIPKGQEQEIFGKFQAELDAEKAKVAESRKSTNVTWLAENAKKPGIKTTASGLQYEVLSASTKADAKSPTAANQVKVNYVGSLIDGTVFDASANHGGPATFPLNSVIKAWTEGIPLMKEGDKFKFYVPPEIGYGESGQGPVIGPNSILVFEVELLEVLGK